MIARQEKQLGFDKPPPAESGADEDESKGEATEGLAALERRRQLAKKAAEQGNVLVYCGQVIRRGEKLSDYPIITESGRWSKPFAGELHGHICGWLVGLLAAATLLWLCRRRDLAVSSTPRAWIRAQQELQSYRSAATRASVIIGMD